MNAATSALAPGHAAWRDRSSRGHAPFTLQMVEQCEIGNCHTLHWPQKLNNQELSRRLGLSGFQEAFMVRNILFIHMHGLKDLRQFPVPFGWQHPGMILPFPDR